MAAHACPPGIPLLTSKGLHFSAFSVKMRLLFLACMLHMCYRSNTDSCIMCVLFYGFNSTVVTKNCSCIAVCVCVVVVVVCVCVCVCRGGIVFSISSVGRRTGEAIVVLETPEHADLAVKRHKFFLDSRYIEVRSESCINTQ